MMTCPGCNGKISRGAKLCRDCWKRARVAGVNLLRGGGDVYVGVDRESSRDATALVVHARTAGQNRAYHGKANAIARLTSRSEREVKAWALEQAATMFGRSITSSRDLNEDEMSELLDRLDEEIAATEASE